MKAPKNGMVRMFTLIMFDDPTAVRLRIRRGGKWYDLIGQCQSVDDDLYYDGYYTELTDEDKAELGL